MGPLIDPKKWRQVGPSSQSAVDVWNMRVSSTTFLMVTAGVMLGRVLGAVAGKRAEIVGGLLLIGIGAAILYEHLSAG